MTGAQMMTPYRRGIAAGVAYREEFEAWSNAARESRDYSNRPVAPTCPYTVNRSVSAWTEGYRREIDKINKGARS